MLYLFQYGKCRFVVRLVSDFANQLAVQHVVVLVQNHDGTSGQALERAVSDGHTVVLDELGAAQGRQVRYVFQTFGAAETSLGEWQVSGDAQHDSVGHVAGLGVELAHGGGAGRGINAWENVQYFALAGKVFQGDVGQIAGNQGKGWRLGTGLWQLAVDLNRVAFESDLSHERSPSDVGLENFDQAEVNHEIVRRPMAKHKLSCISAQNWIHALSLSLQNPVGAGLPANTAAHSASLSRASPLLQGQRCYLSNSSILRCRASKIRRM